MEDFIKFAREYNLIDRTTERIHATGGGAFKYEELFAQEFGGTGVELVKHDEIASLANGMAFVLT